MGNTDVRVKKKWCEILKAAKCRLKATETTGIGEVIERIDDAIGTLRGVSSPVFRLVRSRLVCGKIADGLSTIFPSFDWYHCGKQRRQIYAERRLSFLAIFNSKNLSRSKECFPVMLWAKKI